MNYTCFGNSEAAITLAKVTEDKPNVRRGVTNILKCYRHHLQSTYKIEPFARKQILEFVYQAHLKKVDNTKRVSEVVSYVKNVMYKDFAIHKHICDFDIRNEKT